MSSRWDLLNERLIRVRLVDGATERMTLPEVLASLTSDDRIVGFPGLRHHQRHAWHAFLVQLSAMALQRSGGRSPPLRPEEWTQMLLGLAQGEPTAFTLVVPDDSHPAFFQPPVPAGERRKLRPAGDAPDALDILLTSKNHDLKAKRIGSAEADHWMYVLLTVQTMDGYLGHGKYGISRMNGGLGSRAAVTLLPGLAWGQRVRRDLGVLLAGRDRLVQDFGFRSSGGHALLWLLPWDGTAESKVPLAECDPFFLEVCRRIRLVEQGGVVAALGAATDAPRVEDGDRKGVVGDPWIPVDRTTDPVKALTVSESGFDYGKTHELLLGGAFEQSMAQQVAPADPDELVFHAEALARGRGKTGGYHVRQVPIPARVRRTLRSSEGRETLLKLGRQWIGLAGMVRNKVLKPAVLAYLQGGPDELNFKDDRHEFWVSAFDRQVDSVYFDHLFEATDGDAVESTRRWTRALLALACAELEDAIGRSPVPSVRRYRAENAAWRTFHGSARRNFPDLFAEDKKGGAQDERRT